MKKKVHFHTLGCKLNYSETSSIGKQFLSNGFNISDENDPADVYVINTCSVTESAERECRQIVRRFLRVNPEAFIIVTGCYAQLRPQEISGIEGVDAVIGSSEKSRIFDLIDSFKKNEHSCTFHTATRDIKDFSFASSSEADGRTRAFFKIQDGCDYPCTYCTIPNARGKSRSPKSLLVLENFKKLLDEGYKEIILTGVNVGEFGKDNGENLYGLLREMVKVEGDFRIRISSIEPNLLTDEIINFVKNEEKMCRHFHIPLQSGSSEILRLMKRRYNVQLYGNLVSKILQEIPDAGIGVDVITGFPGETEKLFNETYNFIEGLPVSYLHIFTYSERPDTPAINYEGAVGIPERKKRNKMLRALSEEKHRLFCETMKGKELEALFENDENNGYIKGFTSNYIRIFHKFNTSLCNKFSKIQFTNEFPENCRVIETRNEFAERNIIV